MYKKKTKQNTEIIRDRSKSFLDVLFNSYNTLDIYSIERKKNNNDFISYSSFRKKETKLNGYINENSKEIENLKVTTNHSHTHTHR